MHNRFTKRGVTTLLLLALLIVSVAIILPIVASADGTPANGGEIEDFAYQTLTGADVKNDEDTDLRFLFSINNLDYDAVGFVFSTSDDPVKTGTKQSGNFTESTTVYRSVTANGDEIPAPAGRFWVAVQLSDIPHASFATYVYIRPYVEDGSGTRYGETRRINVCEALGHVHEIKNPTGTATLLNPGTRCGDCDACGLTGITEQDVRAAVATAPKEKNCKKGRSDVFDECPNILSMLNNNGSQKLYPAAENNNEGRDLYYEIDLLYNSTMSNSKPDEMYLCLYNNNNDEYNTLFYFTAKDNSTCWNTYAGGFDWGTGHTALEGPKEAASRGKLFNRYANLNDSPDEKDWGWHRIGVRIHQEAKLSGDNVVYSGASYLYIDGVQRWKIDLDMTAMEEKGTLLFTASKSGGGLSYTNVQSKLVFGFWADDIKNSTNSTYMVYGTPTLSAIKPSEFETGVVPVSDPVESNYVLKNDQVVSAKVWFMAEHPHVWDGNEVLTREATVLQAGKKAEHCTLCGAEKPTGTSVAFVPTVYTSDHGTFEEGDSVHGYGLSKSLDSIRGNEHFYPSGSYKDARNLYFEYSLLWNETLQNWDDATEKSEMKIITFYKSGKHKEFFLLYSNAGKSPYCPYANHFDFSFADETTYNNLDVVLGVYDNGFGGLAGNDNPITEASSPSISYGWHRIGVLVHLEASKGSGTAVNYVGWSALYVDGVKVWKIKSGITNNSSYMVENGLSLFTATNDGSKLTYSDTTPDVRCRFDRFGSSTDPAYAVFGEAYWRIVDTDFDPSTEIEPVVSPAYVDYVIPGTDAHVNGAVYFKAAD